MIAQANAKPYEVACFYTNIKSFFIYTEKVTYTCNKLILTNFTIRHKICPADHKEKESRRCYYCFSDIDTFALRHLLWNEDCNYMVLLAIYYTFI